MIGDRLDTDIIFGISNGLKTVLTLSGITTLEVLMDTSNKIIPDYYVESVANICDLSRKTSFA